MSKLKIFKFTSLLGTRFSTRKNGSDLETPGAKPRRPRQEDCVPLLPVPQTGFPLLMLWYRVSTQNYLDTLLLHPGQFRLGQSIKVDGGMLYRTCAILEKK